MSENKYTPEPWRTDAECGFPQDIHDSKGHLFLRCGSDFDNEIYGEANARRITACVNACAGFSTETLELIASVGGMQHKMTATAAVASQRDELLAALDVALENLRPHRDNCFVSDHYEGDPGAGCNCGIDGVTDYLISTIARAKGEQP